MTDSGNKRKMIRMRTVLALLTVCALCLAACGKKTSSAGDAVAASGASTEGKTAESSAAAKEETSAAASSQDGGENAETGDADSSEADSSEANAETNDTNTDSNAAGEDGEVAPGTPNADTDEANTDAEETPVPAEPEILRFIDAWDEWHEVEIDPLIEKHNFNWDCLRNDENGIYYEGDPNWTIRRGLDVSEHQGVIDWESVRAAGYDFAIVRIAYRGYSESGVLCEDGTWRQNITQAQAAGLDVGAYIFSQAITDAEAEEEADFVLGLLDGYKLELPVVYDPEFIRDDEARTDDVPGEQFTRNTQIFCEKLEAAGYETMIYSNMIWESMVFDLKELAEYPIWYADYEPVPQTPYRFTFWQYSNKGVVPGIYGDTDLNIQFVPKD